jgi:hypothetical protein
MGLPKMKYLIAFLMLCSALNAQQDGAPHAPTGAKPAPVKEQKWYATEIPLTVDRLKLPGHETVDAEGFWKPISASKDKQLADVVAVRIECIREEAVCREADASMLLGVLSVQVNTYDITSWTESGVVADNDADQCNRHTLAINFKGNSVIVTDYPLKQTGENSVLCKPLHDAYSYALHGGQWQLFPPPPWNPQDWNNK